jgi:hypothetical protein
MRYATKRSCFWRRAFRWRNEQTDVEYMPAARNAEDAAVLNTFNKYSLTEVKTIQYVP